MTFTPAGALFAKIVAALPEPGDEPKVPLTPRVVPAAPKDGCRDHAFEPGPYDVCRRCGGERPARARKQEAV